MNIRTYFKIMIIMVAVAFIGGCGSGSAPGTAGNKFVSKSTLAGAISNTVKGIEITLVLPSGVTVKADANGQILAGVVTSLPPNDVTSGNGLVIGMYTPASASAPGKVRITVIRGDSNFFNAGDFFNVVCDVANGVNVTAADFSYEPIMIFDANGADITPVITPPTATITIS